MTETKIAKAEKSVAIMDVNQLAVNQLFRDFNYQTTLIHGHTHRPKTHCLMVDNHTLKRYVLGDWYEQGSYLQVDADGITAYNLES